MPKANTVKRPRTADEARLAIIRTRTRYVTEGLNDDDDHPADVFTDCLDELLELRALREKIMQQQNELKSFFTRK